MTEPASKGHKKALEELAFISQRVDQLQVPLSLNTARAAFEKLDAERRHRETIAWACKVLFGGGR